MTHSSPHVLLVTHRDGGLFRHEVKALLSYASGDLLVLLDTPWARPTDVLYDPHATVAIRQQNAKYAPPQVSCWRNGYGNVGRIAQWALPAAVGDSAKLGGRRFTKLDPSVLPRQVEVLVPSSLASL